MVSWTTLITGIVGAVIGVAGTSLGAWLTGKTQTANLRVSIDAERERARVADKRQTYARCLTSLTEVVFQAAKLGDYSAGVSNEDRRSLALALHDSMSPMVAATNEMRLLPLSRLGTWPTTWPAKWRSLRARLSVASIPSLFSHHCATGFTKLCAPTWTARRGLYPPIAANRAAGTMNRLEISGLPGTRPGVRRAGLPRQSGGADAGPGAAERRRLIQYGSIRQGLAASARRRTAGFSTKLTISPDSVHPSIPVAEQNDTTAV